MMCLCMGLCGFFLIGTLCFLNFCDFFFHQVREVFCHYFSKQVFYPLLISSVIPMIQILLCCMLSQSPLKTSLFFLSLFLFVFMIECFFLPCLPSCLYDLLLHVTYILILSSVFFISDIALFISNWFLLVVSMPFSG